MELKNYYDYIEDFNNLFKDFDAKNKLTKYSGNLFAYAIRQYLMDIIGKDKVSYNNAFIKGNPIEYDLLILKDECKTNESNIYDVSDVEFAVELKASGYAGEIKKYEDIKEVIDKDLFPKKKIYISICDSLTQIENLTNEFDSVFIFDDIRRESRREYIKNIKNRRYKSFIGDQYFYSYIESTGIDKHFRSWVKDVVLNGDNIKDYYKKINDRNKDI